MSLTEEELGSRHLSGWEKRRLIFGASFVTLLALDLFNVSGLWMLIALPPGIAAAQQLEMLRPHSVARRHRIAKCHAHIDALERELGMAQDERPAPRAQAEYISPVQYPAGMAQYPAGAATPITAAYSPRPDRRTFRCSRCGAPQNQSYAIAADQQMRHCTVCNYNGLFGVLA